MRLLERESETQQLERAVKQTQEGQGVAVFVAGPAGAGKSRLISYAIELADRCDLALASVRCGPLDSDLGWGVGREVLAALGSSVYLAGRSTPEFVLSATLAVADAAAERPVLIAIDDAHWADPESLRWMSHLASHAPELDVALLVASREGEQAANPAALDAIAASSAAVLRPHPLSIDATVVWAADILGQRSEEIGAAVYGMTAGSPLLIDQVLTDLAATERVDLAAVEKVRPSALKSMVAARLRRLDEAARLTANAVAIFGDGAHVGLVARLTGLHPDVVASASTQLTTLHILCDSVPLSFTHTLVRAVVYDLIPAPRRQMLHRRAAHLLAGHDATFDQAGLHLLSVPPLPDPDDAALLVKAGRRAVKHNSHARAARVFERALADSVEPGVRGQVLLERARALVLSGQDAGLRAFKSLLAEVDDPREVATVATEAGHALFASAHPDDAAAAYATAAEAAARFDPELHGRLLAHRAMAGLTLNAAPVGDIMTLLTPPLPDDRAILGLACAVASFSGSPASELAHLAQRGLAARSEQVTDGLCWTIATTFIVLALVWSERFGEALQLLDEIVAAARERGALVDVAAGCTYRTLVLLCQGHLERASVEAELARRIYGDMDTPFHGAFETYVLVEMGELDKADALVASSRVHINQTTAAIIPFILARARLRVAQGHLTAARTDLEQVARECQERGALNAVAIPWRSDLVRVLVAVGERGEARSLAEEEVALARAYGATGALGRSLVAMAIADDGSAEAFEEGVDLLSRSSMPLLHADALLQWGSHLRRAGRRRQAEQHLRLSLDIASRCGARLRADLARSELRTLGLRPRREQLTGIASLTPAERRTAGLAAEGRTNRQIAEELFLRVRTVETHLTSCYRKLGLSARAELASVLGPEDPATPELAASGGLHI